MSAVDPQALRRELLEREARLKSLIAQLLDDERLREPSAAMAREARAPTPADQVPLTEREVQILRLVVRGHTNRQIGAQLGVGAPTVRNHLTRIYWKLGATTRTQAAVRALELGLSSGGPAAES